MDYDLKNCLFIGVDMQRVYASSAYGRQQAMENITGLREKLAQAEAPRWQIAMQLSGVPAYMTGAIAEREVEKQRRNHEMLFEKHDGEFVFGKQGSRTPSGMYIDMLKRRRPEVVIFYGWHLEECVLSCAIQADKLLPSVKQVVVLRDCGGQRTPTMDLASICGARIGLIDSAELQIDNGRLSLPDDVSLATMPGRRFKPARRPHGFTR